MLLTFKVQTCLQYSHNMIAHQNSKNYFVKTLYAIIDWVCPGNSKVLHWVRDTL